MNIPIIIDSKDICDELSKLGVKTNIEFTADVEAYDYHNFAVDYLNTLDDRIRKDIKDELRNKMREQGVDRIRDLDTSTIGDQRHVYALGHMRNSKYLAAAADGEDPPIPEENTYDPSAPETSEQADVNPATDDPTDWDPYFDVLDSEEVDEHVEKIFQLDDNARRIEKAAADKVNLPSLAAAASKKLTPFYPFPRALAEFIKTDYGQQMTGKTNLSTLINALPKVKVHSYFITTPLLESLYNVYSWFDAGKKDGEALAKSGEKLGDVFKNFFNGITSEDGIKDIIPTLIDGIITDKNLNQNDIAIKSLPEILYYRLYTTEHNNTYNIPCLLESDYYSSDGNYGWGKGNEYSGEPILAKIIKNANVTSFLSRSLGLSIMPMFNTAGGGAPGNSVIISFDLVNETLDQAKANTEFIRSLVLSNKWIQVGMGQLPGNLYDVSIPGTGQRWFMCTADIRVQHKGALRHLRPESGPLPGTPENETDKCRIPDAYNVRITFESLLPDNVNQMLIAKDKDNQIFMNNRSVFPQLLDNAGKVLKNLTAIGKAKGQKEDTSTEQSDGAAPAAEAGTPTTDAGDQLIENSDKAKNNEIKTETDAAGEHNPDDAEEIVEAVEKTSDGSSIQQSSSPKPTTTVDCPHGIFNSAQYNNIELEVLEQYNPDMEFTELTEIVGETQSGIKTNNRFSVKPKDPKVTKITINIPVND